MVYDNNRLESVFKCIVDSYVETAMPVGSRAVSKVYPGSLSPASIRNVMTDLEEMGLIEQPHTSAGRIPTTKGYRHYVNGLMNAAEVNLEKSEPDALNDIQEMIALSSDIEDIAEKMSRQIANTTRNTSVFFMKGVKKRVLFNDDATDGELDAMDSMNSLDHRLYVDGASHLFDQPEFNDLQLARNLIRTLELKDDLSRFLEKDLLQDEVQVHIGDEIDCGELSDMSIVTKKYSYQDRPMGCVAVIGPTRMHYQKVVHVVDHFANQLTHFLNE